MQFHEPIIKTITLILIQTYKNYHNSTSQTQILTLASMLKLFFLKENGHQNPNPYLAPFCITTSILKLKVEGTSNNIVEIKLTINA